MVKQNACEICNHAEQRAEKEDNAVALSSSNIHLSVIHGIKDAPRPRRTFRNFTKRCQLEVIALNISHFLLIFLKRSWTSIAMEHNGWPGTIILVLLKKIKLRRNVD
ncbi:hypothetical protein [Dawidia soli]|uniref:Uncharacterized protein n=1 Tax=Dawidia soli TaxID=2782352 RepID=A0AAP2DCJ8_9BACT|nr:hypothetical protein [Dawidia soli]MBT1688892.1 hypothetical protein [Dawidia soli]